MEMEREGNRKIKIKEKEENCRKGCLDESKREKKSRLRVWEFERWEKGNEFLCYPYMLCLL